MNGRISSKEGTPKIGRQTWRKIQVTFIVKQHSLVFSDDTSVASDLEVVSNGIPEDLESQIRVQMVMLDKPLLLCRDASDVLFDFS